MTGGDKMHPITPL